MIMVGETLRRERLRRNLDFEQISRELKISTRFLEAIERDQYDKLPGGVFARSFVRQYAGLLGLDAEDLAGKVQGALAPPSSLLHLADGMKPPSIAPIQVPKVEEWRTVGDKGRRWNSSLPAAAMVVVVMLVCSAVYAWLQRPRSQAIAQSTSPVQSSPVQSAPLLAAAPPSTAAAQVPAEVTPATVQAAGLKPLEQKSLEQESLEQKALNQKPVEAKPVEPQSASQRAAESKPVTPNPAATVHVEIRAQEPVWVLARTDGKYAFSGTLAPGETRSVEAVKDIVLRLGNAGGVTISLNGKPMGILGAKGQTRTIQLTSGGFQIAPAAKVPSDAFDPLDRL